MPQAVEEYINTKDFNKVDQIKRNILNLYRQDIGKHAEGYHLKVESIFDENGIMTEEIYKKILFDKLEFNEGMIMENMVAQMLVASGHKLSFYSNPSREALVEWK